MTIKELREALRGKGIKYIWSMKKAELMKHYEKLGVAAKPLEAIQTPGAKDILSEAIIVDYIKSLKKENWLKLRKQGFGGSDIAKVMGMSNWGSPIDVYLDKTTDDIKEIHNQYVEWGSIMEDVIRGYFKKHNPHLEIIENDHMLRSPERHYMLADLDGVVKENGEYGVLEIKTASEYKKKEWTNDVPTDYYLQVQHYMYVTGYQFAYIGVLIGGNNYQQFRVERNEEHIELILQKADDLYQRILDKKIPEADGSESYTQYQKENYTPVGGAKVFTKEDKQELDILCIQINGDKEEIKDLEKQLKALKTKVKKNEQSVIKKLESFEIGSTKNYVISTKLAVQTRFDSKRLGIEKPDLYESYRTNVVKSLKLKIEDLGDKND